MKEQRKSNNQNETYLSFYLLHNVVRVHKKALRSIGEPSYIRFLVNPDELKMVMQAYDRKTFISFRIKRKMCQTGTSDSLVFGSKGFCTLVANKMNWDKSQSYRIKGRIFPRQKIVQFDLSNAEIITRGKD